MDTWTSFIPAIFVVVLALPRADQFSTRWRTAVVLVAEFFIVRYVTRRASGTTRPLMWDIESVLQQVFFVLDVYLALFWLQFFWGLRTLRRRELEQHPRLDDASAPLVDVLIPTYAEQHAVLEKTVVAARALDYPRVRVWLLDDGDRAWVRAAAESWGVNYLKRSKGRHAKAGNLNNAINHIVGAPGRSPSSSVYWMLTSSLGATFCVESSPWRCPI